MESLFPDFNTFSSESQALLEKVIAHYLSFKAANSSI